MSTLGREMVLAKQATPCNTDPKDGTTLDYVVYRRIPGFRCESVVVDTQNEISDHRIIKTALRISVVKQIGGERESRSMDGVDPRRSVPATDASPTGVPVTNTPAANEGENDPAANGERNTENPEDDIWNSPIDWYEIQTVLEEMKHGEERGVGRHSSTIEE